MDVTNPDIVYLIVAGLLLVMNQLSVPGS